MIPQRFLDLANKSLEDHFGEEASFVVEGKTVKAKVIFESNPLTIDIESGAQVLSTIPRITVSDRILGRIIKEGIELTCSGEEFFMHNITRDKTRGLLICELTKKSD